MKRFLAAATIVFALPKRPALHVEGAGEAELPAAEKEPELVS